MSLEEGTALKKGIDLGGEGYSSTKGIRPKLRDNPWLRDIGKAFVIISLYFWPCSASKVLLLKNR